MKNRLFGGIQIICIMWLCITGCQEHIIFHSYQPIQDIGWGKNDTIRFTLPTDENASDCLLQVGIRHHTTYPYSDIWLGIKNMADEKVTTDTLHILLATDKGEWKGNGISGLIQYLHPHPIALHTPENGQNASIQIVHLMNDSTLVGINDIGIQVSVTSSAKRQSEEK